MFYQKLRYNFKSCTNHNQLKLIGIRDWPGSTLLLLLSMQRCRCCVPFFSLSRLTQKRTDNIPFKCSILNEQRFFFALIRTHSSFVVTLTKRNANCFEAFWSILYNFTVNRKFANEHNSSGLNHHLFAIYIGLTEHFFFWLIILCGISSCCCCCGFCCAEDEYYRNYHNEKLTRHVRNIFQYYLL